MNKTSVIIVVIVLIVLGVTWLALDSVKNSYQETTKNNEISNSLPNQQIVAGGHISFMHGNDWALAITPEQVLVKPYIPPCNENFDYCVYLLNPRYAETNFESAGIRINTRADLTSKDRCLNTKPIGYNAIVNTIFDSSSYSTSRFTPLNNAATGHYSNGELYRLFYSSNCYEFETRIGESQFANYATGTKKEFTEKERNTLKSEISGMLNTVTIVPIKEKVSFP